MKKILSVVLSAALVISVIMVNVPMFAEQNVKFAANSCKEKVEGFAEAIATTSDSITLKWTKTNSVSGYSIAIYDNTKKAYKTIKTIATPATARYKVAGLNSGTAYTFKIRAYKNYSGKKYYGPYSYGLIARTLDSSAKINSQNAKIANGYSAFIYNNKLSIKSNAKTTFGRGYWAVVSQISNFKDRNGNYCFAYGDGSYVYIAKLTKYMKLISTIKIKKRYPLLGSVASDSSGNYYIVWGKSDTEGNGNVDTMAISKFKKNGTHLKTVSYFTHTSSNQNFLWETRVPFDAGNCSVVINKGVLVCSYARKMYSGHQSSGVIAVNIYSMTKNKNYDLYISHSFDQRVIKTRYGGVYFADHGDAYSRGFCLRYNPIGNSGNPANIDNLPFHFYGQIGENYTNAELGGICEMSTGLIFAGASAKSMNSSYRNENKSLFIQLIDKNQKLVGTEEREGTCGGEAAKDTGIKWLRSSSSGNCVMNPQVVATDYNCLIVMWENYKNRSTTDVPNYTFSNSYYMIVAPDGTVLQSATPMNRVRLNACEEPLYANGYVCWTTASGKTAVVHRLKVGTLKS